MALYAKAVVLLFMLVVVKDVHSALRGKNSKSTLLKAGRKGGYGGGGGGEDSYNMHAPYVEEKHPGEMFTYNPKAFGQGAQGILPHPLYGNPMQSGVPPKTLLPNELMTGQTKANAPASSVNSKNGIGPGNNHKDSIKTSSPDDSSSASTSSSKSSSSSSSSSSAFVKYNAGGVKKLTIAGSYGNSPQALNVIASQQPAAMFDSSGKPTMAYTKHVQPIWGHAGLGLPASPMEQPGADKDGKKSGYFTSGTVNNLNLYGGAPVDKVGDGKGISPAMFGVSATTYQEVPGSKPRPISAPGYPYAQPNAGAGSPHSAAFGPKHNPYFPHQGNLFQDSNTQGDTQGVGGGGGGYGGGGQQAEDPAVDDTMLRRL